MSEFPFKEQKLCDKVYMRTFDESVDSDELVWHRDREDRIIEATEETDWSIQLDNELPISLNSRVSIKSGVYHRLVKGSGSLSLRVIKL